MAEYRGIGYLRGQLALKKLRVDTRYQYYEMKNAVADFNVVTPPQFQYLNETLGWCGKACDSLADRLAFHTFINDNFDLNNIYAMNNADVLFDSAILSAMISSCSFIYIYPGDDGFPRRQVIDGSNATGVIDQVTGLMTEGYAVLDRNDNKLPTLEAYFIAGRTDYYPVGQKMYSVDNSAPYPLLVPIIYRPDARRPFGHSRISRACMRIMQGALRTLKRSEISAEFYSFPQKYVLGLSDDSEEGIDSWKATISTMLSFTKDSDGDKPTVGQFTQQSMSPYTEQLRTFASLFAGETGLTLDDLGFATENPSSADAIKASHENLRLAARKAQRTFGSGFLNAGYLAACVRDDFPYLRNQFYLTRAEWDPVFEPDAAMLSGIGDGIGKINTSVPGYIGKTSLRQLTGIDPEA